MLAAEEMISILAVGEVVRTQIRTRHDDFVVDAVELHVLQAPALIDSLRYVFLAEAGQVRRVVHAHLDSLWAELADQWG